MTSIYTDVLLSASDSARSCHLFVTSLIHSFHDLNMSLWIISGKFSFFLSNALMGPCKKIWIIRYNSYTYTHVIINEEALATVIFVGNGLGGPSSNHWPGLSAFSIVAIPMWKARIQAPFKLLGWRNSLNTNSAALSCLCDHLIRCLPSGGNSLIYCFVLPDEKAI